MGFIEGTNEVSSATGNRTPGICVTGRDVTNYTIADNLLYDYDTNSKFVGNHS